MGKGGCISGFSGENRETWEDNIKICFQEVGWGRGLDLCLDTERCWAPVTAIVDTGFP